jgi:hypothetical protein
MEGAPQIGRPTRPVLYGWGVFILVVVVATWLVGPLALMVLAMVAGLTLIGTGIRSTGWPRPALIVIGTLILLTPVLMFVDVAFGHWVVTVR